MYAKAANEVLKQLDLNLKNDVEEAVMDQAAKYELIDETLLRRVNMLIFKREYYKINSIYEAAIKDIQDKIKETADFYEIDETELFNAVICAQRGTDYNKKPENGIEVFSYSEEELLLEELEKWIEVNHPDCICQVCVFELLSRLAYEFARHRNILYPDYWNINQHTDINWLQEFEIRHCIELYDTYSMKSCLKDPTINTSIFIPPY